MTSEDDYDAELAARVEALMQESAAAQGLPWEPLTDAEKREASAFGEAIAAVSAIDICGVLGADGAYKPLSAYDTCDQINPVNRRNSPQGSMIVQMLAADRIRCYQDSCGEAGMRLLDTSRAPSYVDSDPLTHTRLYVLTNHSEYLAALEIPHDWPAYVREVLGNKVRCDAHILHRCYDHQATQAVHTLVFNRGEILCAFKICNECLDALSWIGYGHPDYGGPLQKWDDDGDRTPDPFWRS